MTAPIERGDFVSVVPDPEWWDEEPYSAGDFTAIVRTIAPHTGWAAVRHSYDAEWMDGEVISVRIENISLVHSHDGHICGNPAHGEADGWVGYHRR